MPFDNSLVVFDFFILNNEVTVSSFSVNIDYMAANIVAGGIYIDDEWYDEQYFVDERASVDPTAIVVNNNKFKVEDTCEDSEANSPSMAIYEKTKSSPDNYTLLYESQDTELSTTLDLTKLGEDATGEYKLQIRKTDGKGKKTVVRTFLFKVELKQKLAITKQPMNVITNDWRNELKVGLTATGNYLKYNWEFQRFGKTTWEKFEKGNGKSSITINMDDEETRFDNNEKWKVRCTVSDGDGNSVISDEATITLSDEIENIFTIQPEDSTKTFYGHRVSELQDIELLSSEDHYSYSCNLEGYLHYIDEGLTQSGSLSGPGYFMAVKFDGDWDKYDSVRVGVEPTFGREYVELLNNPDKNAVFKLDYGSDRIYQDIIIETTKNNVVTSYCHSLDRVYGEFKGYTPFEYVDLIGDETIRVEGYDDKYEYGVEGWPEVINPQTKLMKLDIKKYYNSDKIYNIAVYAWNEENEEDIIKLPITECTGDGDFTYILPASANTYDCLEVSFYRKGHDWEVDWYKYYGYYPYWYEEGPGDKVTVSFWNDRKINITQQPKSVDGNVNTNVTLSVEAYGEELTYQWYSCPKYTGDETWTAVSGTSAKTANLTLKIDSSTADMCYKCVIKNKYGNQVETNHVLVRNKNNIVTGGAMSFTL